MNRPALLLYQLLIGLSDTGTGALLVMAPALTLRLMRLHAPEDALVYLSFIGAFVMGVGLSCLYGAYITWCDGCERKLTTIWMLTALMRASVAIFVTAQVLAGALPTGWTTVALFDAACVFIQIFGVRRGWLAHGDC